jgi:hypothetical protein
MSNFRTVEIAQSGNNTESGRESWDWGLSEPMRTNGHKVAVLPVGKEMSTRL